jgi:SAM-dependent methyltransferase
MTVERKNRTIAPAMAERYVENGEPLGWFEALYAQAAGDTSIIPWADLEPNPSLVQWLDREKPETKGKTALKIGCGLGDDAEYLASRGFATTAFDISETAVTWCRHRFQGSSVAYLTADLFRPPAGWSGAFDFVLESYTLQVLPPSLRREAMKWVASFVVPHGTLLVIARGRKETDPEGSMPWPLTREELYVFRSFGLTELSFEDYLDDEDPPTRRFRAVYQKMATART